MRSGTTSGFICLRLLRIVFDNHEIELFFQAILNNQFKEIGGSDNAWIVHLWHIPKFIQELRVSLPAIVDIKNVYQLHVIT